MLDVSFRIQKPHGGAVLSTRLKDLSPIITDFIATTQKGARTVAAVAAADYLIGDGRHGLKHYVAYKYIRRRTAYGKTFVSDRQRRYVMARIREGTIDPGVPHRTGNLQRAWTRRGAGTDVRIVNTDPAVLPVMGDEVQARLNRLVGWRVVSAVIDSNLDGALQASARAVDKYYTEKTKQ